jgi:filamentous hemagglutinin
MPFTNGVRDAGELRRHFFKHGAGLGSYTTWQYEALADVFLGGPIANDMAEFARPGGDRVRYNQTTQEFGTMTAAGVIKTYLILARSPAQNRVYFCQNCK